MIHVISDIDMHYFEKDPEQHVIDPTSKYIVITGNISEQNKRTMIYGETLANMYPNATVIFNGGVLESYQGIFGRIDDGFRLRINDFGQSPKNLYYPKGTVVGDYDIYSTIGWPAISTPVNFEESFLSKNLYIDEFCDCYIDDILVSRSMFKKFTLEHVNQLQQEEELKIKNWLEVDQGRPKMLVSSFGDWSNKLIGRSKYTIFPNLDLNNVIWICGGDKDYIGPYRNSTLISLPGRDRSRYVSEETMELIDLPMLEQQI